MSKVIPKDVVTVEVVNTKKEFKWRLVVNGKKSDWTSYFQGILSFEGWMVATAYWDGAFKEFVPFRIEYIK